MAQRILAYAQPWGCEDDKSRVAAAAAAHRVESASLVPLHVEILDNISAIVASLFVQLLVVVVVRTVAAIFVSPLVYLQYLHGGRR